MTVTFSFSVNDPNSAAVSYRNAILTDAIAAGAEWGRFLSGSANIEVQINIQDVPTNRAGTSSATSSFLRTQNGFNVFETGVAGEIRSGVDPNGSSPDAIISVDPDYIRDVLWFDPNPQNPTTSVP